MWRVTFILRPGEAHLVLYRTRASRGRHLLGVFWSVLPEHLLVPSWTENYASASSRGPINEPNVSLSAN